VSEATQELLFWIVIFVVFFFGFRWLQKRKKDKD
jgi:preprotein translocase subunit YajC